MALVNKFNRTGIGADALEHLCDEAHVLTLCASLESQQLLALSISVHVDESDYGFDFAAGGRVGIVRRCRQWLNDPDRKYWTTHHETTFDEGSSWRN